MQKMKTSHPLPHPRGTYTALLVFLLAAGLGAWGAVRDHAAPLTVPESTTVPAATTALPAAQPVTDVPYTMPAIETETETEPTQPEPTTPTYMLPLGSFITKDYSADTPVYSATMRDWRVHTGVDFGDNRGHSVLAIADGRVADVQQDALWGTVLTIEHSGGVTARYCGLEQDSVPEAGTLVEQGVVIGKLGEIPIESKDGPHLHLEITVDGKAVDPWKWLRSTGQ